MTTPPHCEREGGVNEHFNSATGEQFSRKAPILIFQGLIFKWNAALKSPDVLHKASALLVQGNKNNISWGWHSLFLKTISVKHCKKPFIYSKVVSGFIAFVVFFKIIKLGKTEVNDSLVLSSTIVHTTAKTVSNIFLLLWSWWKKNAVVLVGLLQWECELWMQCYTCFMFEETRAQPCHSQLWKPSVIFLLKSEFP